LGGARACSGSPWRLMSRQASAAHARLRTKTWLSRAAARSPGPRALDPACERALTSQAHHAWGLCLCARAPTPIRRRPQWTRAQSPASRADLPSQRCPVCRQLGGAPQARRITGTGKAEMRGPGAAPLGRKCAALSTSAPWCQPIMIGWLTAAHEPPCGPAHERARPSKARPRNARARVVQGKHLGVAAY
jgi:hypothetical protein